MNSWTIMKRVAARRVVSSAWNSKRFGVRQLAAAFLRRKLASGGTSSKLETQKRQQAAALQKIPKSFLLFFQVASRMN
jgi:hypothetical protein